MIVNFFFAGVYVPLQQLPPRCAPSAASSRTVPSWTPGPGTGAAWQHLLVLAGYTVAGCPGRGPVLQVGVMDIGEDETGIPYGGA